MGRCLVLALSLIFCICTHVYANVGPVSIEGKKIELQSGTNIELLTEDVRVTLRSSSAAVVCDFYLSNTGESETINMAFPGGDAKRTYKDEIHYYETSDFEVFLDGRKLNHTYHKDPPSTDEAWDGWYTWQMRIPAGREFHVRVHYTALNPAIGYTYNPYGLFKYILSTGRFWKNRIKDARVTVSFEHMDISQVTDFSPSNGTVNLDKTITWHFSDLEPNAESNINVFYEVSLFDPTPSALDHLGDAYLSGAEAMLAASRFDEFARLVEKATEDEYRNDREFWERRGGVETVKNRILKNWRGRILNLGEQLEREGRYQGAIRLYAWWGETFGDIRGDFRPYSILSYRLADLYRKIGNASKARVLFKTCAEGPPIDEDSYHKIMTAYYGRPPGSKSKFPPYGPGRLYTGSKGLNEYCRLNAKALEPE